MIGHDSDQRVAQRCQQLPAADTAPAATPQPRVRVSSPPNSATPAAAATATAPGKLTLRVPMVRRRSTVRFRNWAPAQGINSNLSNSAWEPFREPI